MTNLPAGVRFGPGHAGKFQASLRDPAGGGTGFNLTDGIAITFSP